MSSTTNVLAGLEIALAGFSREYTRYLHDYIIEGGGSFTATVNEKTTTHLVVRNDICEMQDDDKVRAALDSKKRTRGGKQKQVIKIMFEPWLFLSIKDGVLNVDDRWDAQKTLKIVSIPDDLRRAPRVWRGDGDDVSGSGSGSAAAGGSEPAA